MARRSWSLSDRRVFIQGSCPQPIREEYLLTRSLDPTNEWYTVAKIAGIQMAQAYSQPYGFRAIRLMPTNLCGPEDNFDLQQSRLFASP
jgi:GDP-L-fucose synthase